MTRIQRSDFERQIFVLWHYNDEIKQKIERVYNDFKFIYKQTNLRQAQFGMKYCELILSNEGDFFEFSALPKLLDEPLSSFYVYRRDVLEKLFEAVKSR